ncbi:MAG: aminodeoxychorismate synthase component I [Planctomycetota bacterium]
MRRPLFTVPSLPVHCLPLPRGLDPLESLLSLKGEGPSVLLDGQPPSHERNRRAIVLFDPFDVVAIPAGSDRIGRGDPLGELFEKIARYGGGTAPSPPSFAGGAAGFLSYDLGRHLERLPATAGLRSAVPDLWFGLFNRGVLFDLASGEARLFCTEIEAAGRAGPEYARRSLREARDRILAGPPAPRSGVAAGPLVSNFNHAEYRAAVEAVRESIRSGDVYQVNLSQRFEAACDADPFALYRRLRRLNPAPFSALVDTGEAQLLSSSPERFLRLLGDMVETRPIKGTRPRTGASGPDRIQVRELMQSRKDAAELAMIVDLLRNDLGKVARYGSVVVKEAARLEAYATVFHREAVIQARLREGLTGEDLLKATFPGGSVTGAPKIRAMELIEELEGIRRGAFTGSIGWIGFDGDLELNIAIRTLILEAGRAHFHCGGGVVLDSDPEEEYRETLAKGRALANALGCSFPGDSDDLTGEGLVFTSGPAFP